MGYLAYIFSLIWLAFQDTTGLTFNQGTKMFLDQAVIINKWMFWAIIGIYLVVGFILLLLFLIKQARLSGIGILSGCWLAFFIFVPIGQGFVWWMSSGIANTFGLDGIIQPVKFWVLVILTVLIGIG